MISEKFLLCPAAVAVAVLMTAQAQAQTQVTTLPQVTVSGQPEAYSVDHTSAGTRTSTPIEQVPQSVVVIPRAMIEDQGSQTLSDVLRNVSNVTAIDQRDSNFTPFKIRGFSSITILDGVAVPGFFQNHQTLSGVQQVSVLKGPSGGLYGGSQGMNHPTQGGAIVITTVQPEQTPVRQVGLRFGNFGQEAFWFDFNQPLSPVVAVRLTGEYSNKDSETDQLYFKRQSLAPSIAITPSRETKIVLRLSDVKNETLDYPGLPRAQARLPYVIDGVPRSRFIGAMGLPPTTNNSQGRNLQWTQKLGEQWDFSLTLAKTTVAMTEVGAFNASVIDAYLGMFGMPASLGHVTQDVYGYRMGQKFDASVLSPSVTGRFNTGAARHTVTAGVDHESSTEDAFMLWSNPLGTGLSPMTRGVNLAGTSYATWIDPATGSSMFDSAYVRNFSATTSYVQDHVSLGNWHFLGSLRFNRLEIENKVGTASTTKTLSHATPRIGATYEFTSQLSAFAGYGEAVQTPYLTTFAPGVTPSAEDTSQTEVGLRMKNLAGVSATLALFDLKRRNVATAYGASNYLSDQGAKGIDIDLRYRLNESWQWVAAYTHQSAEYTGTTFSQVASYVGKQLFNIPKQQLRLAGRYDAKTGAWRGLGLGLGLTYQSELPGDGNNSFFTPASTVWDAQASYQARGIRYGVAIGNLLDKRYLVPSAYFGGGQLLPAAPRTLTASAVFSF